MQQAINSFAPTSRQHWRAWLQEHHQTAQAVWLIYPKKKAPTVGVNYAEAVEEALCFGWIDSRAQPIDDYHYRQFFSPRKPTSGWSKVNKARIERLTKAGLMTPTGLVCVERAQQNGSWLLLDDIEALVIPADLEDAFGQKPNAKAFFCGLSRSDQRTLLLWLVLAKRTQTRQNRLAELVEDANRQQKPKILQRVRGQRSDNLLNDGINQEPAL
ncbi:hypothetical protein DYU11_29865 [Fibrisoma montanum]|uniref:Bacteriocin-protection protein n=1 Tax=Fibrisoma montanum TaxID=2305895 RepID=A0A418LXI1_9BACT|nr:YdeI/OmpD-associated family protein [Fibrisoma montanum]RIV17920.1 hypothetical protein DYU11_29865 [Fibrisoma montanum]